jgi:hypothetical protein
MDQTSKVKSIIFNMPEEKRRVALNKMKAVDLWQLFKILTVPEKEGVCDLLTIEKMSELKQCANPYRKPIYDPKTKFLEFSYINTNREYEHNLSFTAMVGFIYKVATEYEMQSDKYMSETDPEYMKIFNTVQYNFNIDKLQQYYDRQHEMAPTPENYVRCLRAKSIVAARKKLPDIYDEQAKQYCQEHSVNYNNCYPENVPVTPEDLVQIKEFVKCKLGIKKTLQEKQTQRQDQILDFLDHNFKFDPNNHIRCGYFPHYEKMLVSRMETNPDNFQVIKTPTGTEMIVNDHFEKYLIPPADTHSAFRTYFDSNYECLRECTDNIYFPAQFECAVIARETFASEEQARTWENKYANDFDTSVMRIPFGNWIFIDPWTENRNKINFDNSEKTKIIHEILEKQKENEKIGRKIIEKKAHKHGGRAKSKMPLESQIRDFGVEQVGEHETEVKVFETKLLRKPRAAQSQMSNWTFSIEAEL